MNVIVLTTLILGLIFGGGASVSAAQNDLPGQPLYQLKLASEEASLWLSSSPQGKINLLMEQAQTRLQETTQLVSQGTTPPAYVGSRMQERIHLAIQLANGLPEGARIKALEQIQERLRIQEQLMLQLEQVAAPQVRPVLEQDRLMLQTQLQQAEQRLAGPAELQQQNQDQEQYENREQNQNQQQYPVENKFGSTPPPDVEQTPATAQGSCTCTPALDGTGEQYRNGNPSAGTPQPPNGNGKGGTP